MYKLVYHVGAKDIVKGEYSNYKCAITVATGMAQALGLTMWRNRKAHWCVNDSSENGENMPCRHLILYRDDVALDALTK